MKETIAKTFIRGLKEEIMYINQYHGTNTKVLVIKNNGKPKKHCLKIKNKSGES